jgi:hypothetical protein
MSQITHQPGGPFYIGIDFHKHYSVFCVIDLRGLRGLALNIDI